MHKIGNMSKIYCQIDFADSCRYQQSATDQFTCLPLRTFSTDITESQTFLTPLSGEIGGLQNTEGVRHGNVNGTKIQYGSIVGLVTVR